MENPGKVGLLSSIVKRSVLIVESLKGLAAGGVRHEREFRFRQRGYCSLELLLCFSRTTLLYPCVVYAVVCVRKVHHCAFNAIGRESSHGGPTSMQLDICLSSFHSQAVVGSVRNSEAFPHTNPLNKILYYPFGDGTLRAWDRPKVNCGFL